MKSRSTVSSKNLGVHFCHTVFCNFLLRSQSGDRIFAELELVYTTYRITLDTKLVKTIKHHRSTPTMNFTNHWTLPLFIKASRVQEGGIKIFPKQLTILSVLFPGLQSFQIDIF